MVLEELTDKMGIADSIRTTIRNVIDTYGGTAEIYSFGSATKTQSDEGDYTVSDWGTATEIKVISSNNKKFSRLFAEVGQETDKSERVFIVKDNVTVEEKDKIVIGGESYEVTESKFFDPIQNTNVAKRIVVNPNERY